MNAGSFPFIRPRRVRTSAALRALVTEHHLRPTDFIAPLFVHEGGTPEPIASLPGHSRHTLSGLVAEARELHALGVQAVLLFAKVPAERKSPRATEALRPEGLLPRAVMALKDALPELCVMTDVALDPYNSHGHDGLVEDGQVLNDATNEMLAQMAVVHAQAGADVVAPSDMMDGRVAAIRAALELAGHPQVAILAYTAKYASALYGPFREALDSAPVEAADIPKDKKTYQMNPANVQEAVHEALQDAQEGADILMVKPGGPYLDVVRAVAEATPLPVAVYQVSGEYAMIHAAAAQGWLNKQAVMMETLLGFKRAGARMVATYFAKDAARLLA